MIRSKHVELLILLLAIVIVPYVPYVPTFAMASDISLDEWVKSGAGVTSSGVILGAYKLWKGKQ